MSFQQALSGLNASSSALNAIGNNIANSSTVGFKSAGVQFADAYAASMQGGGTGSVGIGSSVSGVKQVFTQGNLTTTNNPLDVAINGAGMFRLDNNGTVTYTRNGQYMLNKEGYVINNQGLKLTGYAADPVSGVIVPGRIVPLQINNTAIPPVATTKSQIQANLDSRATLPVSVTYGTAVSNGAASYPYTPTVGVNDQFTINVDGAGPVNVTIPAPVAPATSYTSPGALAAAIQTATNTALTAPAAVDVSVDGSGQLIVSSRLVGTGSSVALSAVAGNTGYASTFAVKGAPIATAGVNFSSSNVNGYTASTAQTVYDSLGNPHTLSLYYIKTAMPGQWDLYTSLESGQPAGPTRLVFNAAGVLTSPSPGAMLVQSFDVSTGANTPLAFDLDLTGTTQYGIPFGTNQLVQDGYTSGKLSGMSVSPDGTVQGRYSNGKSRNMGQLVLCNFNNPNGLQSLGNNQWAETSESGSPIPGGPGTGNLGVVQSGSVEDSNVDLTQELVNMITAQRTYQSNAQTIKTQDQVLQTLVNLR